MIRCGKKRLRLWIALGAAGAALLLALAIWQWDAIRDPRRLFVNEDDYKEEIAAAAAKHGIDRDLVRALIYQESRFRADMRGKKGEIGLMQVLPSGAAAEWARVHKRRRPFAWELYDVGLNLEIGCWYLARALRRWGEYDRRIELALADYNAGTTRAREWAPSEKSGEVIHRVKIASTKKYITEIMKRYRSYTRDAGGAEKTKTVTGGK